MRLDLIAYTFTAAGTVFSFAATIAFMVAAAVGDAYFPDLAIATMNSLIFGWSSYHFVTMLMRHKPDLTPGQHKP